MNKSAIKNFAIWSRKKLISDIKTKAGLVGITEAGIASPLPQSNRDVQFFDIGTKDYAAVRWEDLRKRAALVNAIEAKQKDCPYAEAFRFVVEKAAYTWFNRLIAIRFMEVNDYLPSRVRVLSSENPGKAEPDMVTRPGDTDMEFTEAEHDYIGILWDENQLDELFRFLFIKQCRKLHEVLPELFDDDQSVNQPDSYLDYLLTLSFTDQDGVLWHLVHDIPEKDFRIRTPEDDERQKLENIPEEEMPAGQVEIIGWLYQYYNTEPKDRVFANLKKNIKISKDDIPAATQLFTPDWIVRYMVENSLGRLWVEGHPNEELKRSWKYYLEEAEQEPQVQAQLAEIRKGYAALRPEDIKVIDPCMGSGHILVRLFDVLMQIYDSQGWPARDAARSIVENNLYGLDIDDRAAQLAYFAVMMKARQYDRRFLEQGIKPHVYAIQESNNVNSSHLAFMGGCKSMAEKNKALDQLNSLLDALYNAKEYGSILDMPVLDWPMLRKFVKELDTNVPFSLESTGIEYTQAFLSKLINQGDVMTQKYDAIVTNPPYMSSSGMGIKLSEFVKAFYPDSKSDLFAVFIERIRNMLVPNAYQAMITQHVWMFLSSFEKLRLKLQTIDTVNMAHLGARAFEEIGGEVVQTTSFVMRNSHVPTYNGTYVRLIAPTTQQGKENMFLHGENRYIAQQNLFSAIPGSPVSYWASHKAIASFDNTSLRELLNPKQGTSTGNDETFVRFWFEIERNKLSINQDSLSSALASGFDYFPLDKGGEYRKWYGNNEKVIRLNMEAYKKLLLLGNHLPSRDLYFIEGITWSKISTGKCSFRYDPAGFVFSSVGMKGFPSSEQKFYIISFLNSTVAEYFLGILSPGMSTVSGDLEKLPILVSVDRIEKVNLITAETLRLTKNDWDSFETSWDFQHHPLLPAPGKPELSVSGEQAPDIDEKQMEFAVFCVENLAEDLGQDATAVFDLLTSESDLLYSYIIPCYEPLHSQDKEYIIDDIKRVMRERGLLP